MAWRSYLIAKQCYSLFVFTSNSLVLQDIDWTLLDPHILVLLTSYLPSLCWHWHPVAAVSLPHAVWSNETASTTAALGMNCIPMHDGCMHSQVWWMYAFPSVMDVCITMDICVHDRFLDWMLVHNYVIHNPPTKNTHCTICSLTQRHCATRFTLWLHAYNFLLIASCDFNV